MKTDAFAVALATDSIRPQFRGRSIPARGAGPEDVVSLAALGDAGAIVINGTDTPVEDVDPIMSFYGSVSRETKDGTVFLPEQRVTRDEALSAYTLNNAYAAFEEHEKGSLTPGKLADIVVLSKNIMTVPEDEIPTARVDLTILGGKVRFERRSAAEASNASR